MNLFSPMTWKSTAVVSAAGLFATWLASTPPSLRRPADPIPSTPTAAKTEAAAAEIQEQASRLHARIQDVVEYREPARNPFRFGARIEARPTPAAASAAAPPESEPMTTPMPARPTVLIALAGIAQDTVEGRTVRTAIVSMPDGVQLVKEGDVVAGQYKVGAIGADAVELVRVSDGSTVRLGLKP